MKNEAFEFPIHPRELHRGCNTPVHEGEGLKRLVMICALGLVLDAPLMGQNPQNVLIQALDGLKGRSPFRGSISATFWSGTTKDGKREEESQSQVQAMVEARPGGLSLSLPAQVATKAMQEQATLEPRAKTPPVLAGLSKLRLEEVMPLLNFAPRLHFLVSRGVLKSVGQENYNNRPHRYYDYEMQVALSESDNKKVKKLTYGFRVWVNDSEVPVGMRHSYAKSIKLFMGMGMDEERTENYAFEVREDRLVVKELERMETTKSVVVEQKRTVFELR